MKLGGIMKVQLEKKSAPVRNVRRLSVSLLVFIFTCSVLTGSAWSFDTIQGSLEDPVTGMSDSANAALTTNSPSPAMADSCLPLLKSIRHVPSNAVMDRNQRSAGKAATFGLVFGIRFALAPPKAAKSRKKKSQVRFDLWQPEGAYAGDRQALAIAAYRQCQKEKALEALGDFRWIR